MYLSTSAAGVPGAVGACLAAGAGDDDENAAVADVFFLALILGTTLGGNVDAPCARFIGVRGVPRILRRVSDGPAKTPLRWSRVSFLCPGPLHGMNLLTRVTCRRTFAEHMDSLSTVVTVVTDQSLAAFLVAHWSYVSQAPLSKTPPRARTVKRA